jgi:TP901 family phage tail tape measure protein
MPATTVDTIIFRLEVDDQATKKLSSVGGLAADIFKSMADASVNFVKDSVDAYNSYEKALYNVSKTTGRTGEALEELSNALRETAKPLGALTAENLLEIAEVAGQMGIKSTEDIRLFSEQVGIGAIVLDKFGGSTEKLGTHLAKSQNIFKLTAQETDNMVSTLYALKTATAANELDISNFNLKMGQFAAQMNVAFQESSAWGAALVSMGGVASRSATQMGAAFTTLTSDNNKLQAAVDILTASLGDQNAVWLELEKITGQTRGEFQSIGDALKVALSEDTFATMNLLAEHFASLEVSSENLGAGIDALTLGTDAFGSTGKKAMSMLGEAILEGKLRLDTMNESWENANAHMTAYERLTGRAGEQWNVLGSIINDIMLTVGGPLVEAFGSLLQDYVIPVANEFAEWLNTSNLMTEVVPELLADISAAIGEVLNKAVEVVKNIDWSSAIQKAYEWYDKLKTEVLSWDWAQIWNDVKAAASGVIELIQSGIPVIVTAFNGFMIAIELFKTTWEGIKPLVEPLFKLFKINFELFQSIIVEGPIKALDLLWETIQKVFPSMSDWIGKIGSALGALGEKLVGIIEKVRQLGKESHEQSVFPEMKAWIEQNESAMIGFSGQISRSIGELNALGAAQTNISPSLTPASNSLSSSTSGSKSSLRGGAMGFGSATTNIVFQGTNVVDSASENRFTRKISNKWEDIKSRTVRSLAYTSGWESRR